MFLSLTDHLYLRKQVTVTGIHIDSALSMTPKFKKRSQFNTDVNFWGVFVGMHGSYIYMKAYYYIYTETNPISFLVEMKGVEICRKYPGFNF